MNRRKLKQQVFELLAGNDPERLRAALTSMPARDVVHPLFSALCSSNEMVKWRAVSGFGWVVSSLAKEEFEAARVVMRRFLWSLNDESGGIGWGAPEAMAEIMAREDRLADEYLHMLISYTRDDGPEIFQDGNFLELPLLQRGLLWGLGRLCRLCRERMIATGIEENLVFYLDSPDGQVQGLAVWALEGLGSRAACEKIRSLTGEPTGLAIYWEGEMIRVTLGQLAAEYVDRCRCQAPGKGHR